MPSRAPNRAPGLPEIRPAQEDDHPALVAVLRAASLANPGDRDFLLAHPEVMVVEHPQLHDGRIHLCQEGGEVLGFVSLLRPVDGWSELDGLFVRPTHWRRGLGRLLLTAGLRQARAEGASRVRTVANLHALPFYAALGFRPVADAHPAVDAGLAMVLWRPT